MKNLFQVGDRVVLNDIRLEAGDQHERLIPGTTGVIKKVGQQSSKGWDYEVLWDVPDSWTLNTGWWVYEKNLEPAGAISVVDIETLL